MKPSSKTPSKHKAFFTYTLNRQVQVVSTFGYCTGRFVVIMVLIVLIFLRVIKKRIE